MAQELALRHVANADAILAGSNSNASPIPTARRASRSSCPRLSADANTRDAFFSSLARVENRAHERWVSDGLSFINHPLRRGHAEVYITPGLELLREIQRTGDIFFPLNWTGALLDGHNSVTAGTERQRLPGRAERLSASVAAGDRATGRSTLQSGPHPRIVIACRDSPRKCEQETRSGFKT